MLPPSLPSPPVPRDTLVSPHNPAARWYLPSLLFLLLQAPDLLQELGPLLPQPHNLLVGVPVLLQARGCRAPMPSPDTPSCPSSPGSSPCAHHAPRGAGSFWTPEGEGKALAQTPPVPAQAPR